VKKSVAILVLLFFISLTTQAAQQRQLPDLGAIISTLNLNSEQALRLTTMVEKHHLQMRSRQDQQNKSEQKHQNREQFHQELLTVLSYEQLYQFDKHMRQFRHQRKKRDRCTQ
jgi:hypothetical protein